jgi:hypothetical protein
LMSFLSGYSEPALYGFFYEKQWEGKEEDLLHVHRYFSKAKMNKLAHDLLEEIKELRNHR